MPATANGRQRFSMSDIVKISKPLPDRIIVYAPPKWGKTSFVAQFPEPIFLTTKGEDGLQKLIQSGQLKQTSHFSETANTWNDLLLAVNSLVVEESPFKTFILDTINGADQLAHIKTCEEEFSNDWGEGGFNSFGRGEKVSANKLMRPLIELLDRLREARNMRIVLTCHTETKNQKNPAGLDYPKTQPAMSNQTWKMLSKWADMILYGDYETTVAKEDPKSKISKAKAQGEGTRILYCQPKAYYEAGNRHGLPEEIEMGSSPQEAWTNFVAAFPKKSKQSEPSKE